MIVISDTLPIIFFAKIKKLTLLKDLYSKIYIPTQVWEEITFPLSQSNKGSSIDLKYEIEAKEEGWLIVKDPEKSEYHEIALQLTQILGRGEAYAIALCLELTANLLLINDKIAKEIAEEKGIKTIWNIEILLNALEKGLIKTFNEFKNILDNLIEIGLWIEKRHYEDILLKAKRFSQ